MFGIPRNLVNVPLPEGPDQAFECRCFPEFLNGLFVYAMAHPEFFPGADEERGYMAVQDAVGKLTGLQLDGQLAADGRPRPCRACPPPRPRAPR